MRQCPWCGKFELKLDHFEGDIAVFICQSCGREVREARL